MPQAPDVLGVAVDRASRVLDIGRTFDVVNRHKHTTDILVTSDLNGFSHDEIALVAAVVARAGDRHADVPPLPSVRDAFERGLLDRAAIVLALADEIVARCRERSSDCGSLQHRPPRDAHRSADAVMAG